MNRLLTGMITACGALALSSGAFAQTQNYGRLGMAYFQDRDDHGVWDQERLAREYRGAFYDRLQADLDRAERAGYLRGNEFDRIRKAHREVGEFQSKWSRGVFDPHEMDAAIASVQRVEDISVLRSEDRDALRDDLFAMRRFRAHMEGRRY
jgi:hypothetical protein